MQKMTINFSDGKSSEITDYDDFCYDDQFLSIEKDGKVTEMYAIWKITSIFLSEEEQEEEDHVEN